MTALGKMGARFGLALLGAGALLVAAPAGAQVERPDDALSRHLRALAASPKSLSALLGAGKAALELGDPQAAVTFFARAEEIAPRDGRIKMGIGSALVQLQQPRAALKFFNEAVELGAAEGEVARERGLAHDIAGNPREAQRDYRLALQRGRDEEAARRLALSLAISGQREPALQLLEDQLLLRDPSAERTRALVLALVGDQAGAGRVVRAAMPRAQADGLAAFLARLPQLSPAERALAVHLGVFPQAGRASGGSWASAAPSTSGGLTDAGRPDSGQTSLARRTVTLEPVSTAPRRRPGSEEAAAKPKLPTPQSAIRRPAAAAAKPAIGAAAAPASKSVKLAASKPKPAPAQAQPATAKPEEARGAATAQPSLPRPQAEAPASQASSTFDLSSTPGAVTPTKPEPVPSASRLADLAAALEGIKEPATSAPPAAAKPKATAPNAAASKTPVRTAAAGAAAKPKTPAAAPAKKAAAPAPEPSRHWVQVAGGADKAALPREFARLKAKAPKLLGTRTAWVTPVNATNRLLVGPFASAKEAQAFVNSLAEADLSGFAWQSAAGQKVEKLPAK